MSTDPWNLMVHKRLMGDIHREMTALGLLAELLSQHDDSQRQPLRFRRYEKERGENHGEPVEVRFSNPEFAFH